jgi:VIT1/CCC1 family predicted Fe2+/Mn2+ transporter
MSERAAKAALPRDGDAFPSPSKAPQILHRERHRAVNEGTAKAALFGISDGLLTNVSLILGVVGAHPAVSVVRLAGIVGAVAGCFSMAAGEYLSLSGQVDLSRRELAIERRELETDPDGEYRELVEIYLAKGIGEPVARDLAREMMREPTTALDTHVREELGLNPGDLGSPVKSGVASFLSFGLGAIVPLFPWFFAAGLAASMVSIALSFLLAMAIGVVTASFSGRPRLGGAVRQLAVCTVAAAVTFAVGSALGAGLAGL